MTNKLNASLHNEFYLEVVDGDTGEIKQTAKAYNVVCVKTWEKGMCDMRHISIGCGIDEITAGPPAVSSDDRTMKEFILCVGTTAYRTEFESYSKFFHQRKATITSDIDKVITEIGLGQNTAFNSSTRQYEDDLYTHAILNIVDEEGNVGLLKRNGDTLNIYATVYITFSGFDGMRLPFKTGENVRLNISDIPIFAKLLGMDSNFRYCFYNDQTGSNNYTLMPKNRFYKDADPTYVRNTYLNGFQNSGVWTFYPGRLELNDYNTGYGFRYVAIGTRTYDGWNWNDSVLALIGRSGWSWREYSTISNETVGVGDGTTKDYKLEFMYPRDVTIKINGNETTDFTVDYAVPSTDFTNGVDSLSLDSTSSSYLPRRLSDSKTMILRNPAYEVGIKSFKVGSNSTVEASNDLVNWITLGQVGSSVYGTIFTVPSGSEHYKFYKFDREIKDNYGPVTAKSTYTGFNLHFTTPPEEGAVITASYKADCIAKNSKKVFDFTLSIEIEES